MCRCCFEQLVLSCTAAFSEIRQGPELGLIKYYQWAHDVAYEPAAVTAALAEEPATAAAA